jgi:hypothetical protein
MRTFDQAHGRGRRHTPQNDIVHIQDGVAGIMVWNGYRLTVLQEKILCPVIYACSRQIIDPGLLFRDSGLPDDAQIDTGKFP